MNPLKKKPTRQNITSALAFLDAEEESIAALRLLLEEGEQTPLVKHFHPKHHLQLLHANVEE
jgi:hypothetical protein